MFALILCVQYLSSTKATARFFIAITIVAAAYSIEKNMPPAAMTENDDGLT